MKIIKKMMMNIPKLQLIKKIMSVSTEFDNQNIPHHLDNCCERILEHFLSIEQFRQSIEDEIRSRLSSITSKDEFLAYEEKYFWKFQSEIIEEIFDLIDVLYQNECINSKETKEAPKEDIQYSEFMTAQKILSSKSF